MFDSKFRIKIVKHHYFGEDDKLLSPNLYDVYINVGILPPIFNKWVIERKSLKMFDVSCYIRHILINNKEIEIKY